MVKMMDKSELFAAIVGALLGGGGLVGLLGWWTNEYRGLLNQYRQRVAELERRVSELEAAIGPLRRMAGEYEAVLDGAIRLHAQVVAHGLEPVFVPPDRDVLRKHIRSSNHQKEADDER